MGLFTQMKQMKAAVAEAPALIANAQQLQQAQLAQAQMMAATPPVNGEPTHGEPDMIAGVSIELYAVISRELSARGGDQALAPVIAGEHGIDRASWDEAVAGWNARMVADPSVARRFNASWRNA